MGWGRIGRVFAVWTMFAVAWPSGGGAHETAPAIVGTVVGAEGVNIRTCPRADCDVVAVALLNEAILVNGNPVDGFLPVDWGGVTGWAYGLYVATPDRGTPELRLGTAGCNRVAFIFNVGVGYEPRVEILDYLKTEHIPATVFPMGWWAIEHGPALKAIADAGFPIGSHGHERLKLTEQGDAAIKHDIASADAAITAAIGRKPDPFFTPYAAAADERVRNLIARAGYLPIGWTVPAADWDFGVSADQVFKRVVPNVTDGAIVEFHLDAPASAESTAVALPWIVERLRAKGYQFVTVAEMARPCSTPT